MRLSLVKPSAAFLVMVMALLALAFAAAPAESQSAANGRYDTDGDRLIEITYLEQLVAMSVDNNGDGQVDPGQSRGWIDYYAIAFPISEGERVCIRPCSGYELTRSLDFYDPGSYRSGEVNLEWLQDDGWAPVNGFAATFDGNGHTITGLLINRPGTDYVGLFGWTALGSIIKNVGLVDVHVTGKHAVGALVGQHRGMVTNSYATGDVAGANNVGGLVGELSVGSSIERSYADVEVRGGGYQRPIGGLVGVSSGTIVASHAIGDVAGADMVGGLVGRSNPSGFIRESYATGNVNGSDGWIGGLVGYNSGPVSVSYATGNVNGNTRVGGLVGINEHRAARLQAVYATGNVSGASSVGGLVGMSPYSFSGTGSIRNSYALGQVRGGSETGGLLGGTSGSIHASYWNLDIVYEDQRNRYGEGKTTAELQSPTGYTGIYGEWDDGPEGDVWDFGTGSQYPALKADMNGDGIATVGEFGIQHDRTPSPSCIGNIATGGETTGRWLHHCGSVNRPGSYGLYYTLNLSEESEVIITLESEDADTYLFLLEGSGTSGTVRHKDDDYIGGGSNSRIHETLAAGVYTIEAATYGVRTSGSFTLKVELAQGAQEPGPECVQSLAVDGGAVSGAWTGDCPSVSKEGSYARYYTLALSEESEVSITLESDDADTYLFLLEGSGTSGGLLYKNDDYSGGGRDSQIMETLSAGSYTIEATTYKADTTGGFTLSVETVEEEEPGPPGPTPPPPSDACGETLARDGSVSGEWSSGCQSQVSGRGYARYYTFTLTEESEVDITLERTSGEADTYLYLREGESRSGDFLHDNDDDGGTTRSRIAETLAAGTYTVEATTYEAGQTGSFTLTVSGLGGATTATDSCVDTLSANGSVIGEWASGCDSTARAGSHARFYSFTLSEDSEVTITLDLRSGEADTYLYLREGENTRSGDFLYENDDDGGTTRSQIQETLDAGTYTIEATTYEAGQTGLFTLTVSGL